jgi:hypothetical protein
MKTTSFETGYSLGTVFRDDAANMIAVESYKANRLATVGWSTEVGVIDLHHAASRLVNLDQALLSGHFSDGGEVCVSGIAAYLTAREEHNADEWTFWVEDEAARVKFFWEVALSVGGDEKTTVGLTGAPPDNGMIRELMETTSPQLLMTFPEDIHEQIAAAIVHE